MPELTWLGKEKVVNHHLEVPYCELNLEYRFGAEKSTGNKIIHGDNLEALKALLPAYEQRIKVIYIDPPYNTGQEHWVYNDNVQHPRIQKWLNKVVGKENEDLTRHDKWLCMMYPRLRLLHQLLREDGLLFISIDDNEVHHLQGICNEIFGANNRLATIVWDLGTGTQAGHFTRSHEYILVFAKNKKKVPPFPGGEGEITHSALKRISVKNPESEFRFPKGTRFDANSDKDFGSSWGGQEQVFLRDGKIQIEDGKLAAPVTLSAGWAQKRQMSSWFQGEPTFDSKGQKVLEFYFNKNGILKYRKERSIANPPTVLRNLANTRQGSATLRQLFDENVFDFPKPPELLTHLLRLTTKEDDIVLDSFAGSGTTGHAVLRLNEEDKGQRQFILIELEDYAEAVTAERVKRVIAEFPENTPDTGFDFYQLGTVVCESDGRFRRGSSPALMRQFLWHFETKSALPNPSLQEPHLIGVWNDTAYYLHHHQDHSTTLNMEFLATIQTSAKHYVVFADRCTLDDAFMQEHRIRFQPIPYA